MKNKKWTSIAWVAATAGCVLCSAVLAFPLVSAAADALKNDGAEYYPEPAVRPDISDCWVWDSSRGVYVLPQEMYDPAYSDVLKEQAQDPHADPGQGAESVDPLDIAIAAGIQYAQEHTSAFSDPMNALQSCWAEGFHDNCRAGMAGLSNEAAEHLWERFCTEQSNRGMKVAALEAYLALNLDMAFCDLTVQEIWYREFCARKADLPEKVTMADVPVYGKLLLPALCGKDSLDEEEMAVFTALTGSEDFRGWQEKNADTVAIIRSIVDTTPAWVA